MARLPLAYRAKLLKKDIPTVGLIITWRGM